MESAASDQCTEPPDAVAHDARRAASDVPTPCDDLGGEAPCYAHLFDDGDGSGDAAADSSTS